MALFKAKLIEPKIVQPVQTNENPFIVPGRFTDEELPIASIIQKRRMQMLIHSYIYYKMDTNIITDATFDTWGKELTEIQNKYPKIASRVCYAEAFQDWDGSTGFHLPCDEWVVHKAHYLSGIQHTGGETVVAAKPRSQQEHKKKEVIKVEHKGLFKSTRA